MHQGLLFLLKLLMKICQLHELLVYEIVIRIYIQCLHIYSILQLNIIQKIHIGKFLNFCG